MAEPPLPPPPPIPTQVARPSEAEQQRLVLARDAFMKLGHVSSPLMYLVISLVNLSAAPLPMTLVRRFAYPLLRRTDRGLAWTRVIVDGYLVLIIALEAIALFMTRPGGNPVWPIIAAFGLWDLLVATLRDLLINPSLHRDKDGPFLLVQDPIRWFALFPTAPAQAILCFAVLFRHFSDAMGSTFLTTPGNALYYSFCTFLTVDSSAVTPETSSIGKTLVVAELMFFVTILTTKLPLAIALTRAKGGGGASESA